MWGRSQLLRPKKRHFRVEEVKPKPSLPNASLCEFAVPAAGLHIACALLLHTGANCGLRIVCCACAILLDTGATCRIVCCTSTRESPCCYEG
eukprot:1087350-Amphidinium_carterae.1